MGNQLSLDNWGVDKVLDTRDYGEHSDCRI